MPSFRPDALNRLAVAVFKRAGAPTEHASCVADHLVSANLAGHDSHGVLRILQYVDMIDIGRLKPTGQMQVTKRFAGGAAVDGDSGFGQVIAGGAMRLAIEIAKANGTGAVTVRNCCHTGRLGAYTQMAAEAGLVGIVVVNAGGGAQLVSPFGGIARRLSTNPISIGAPTTGPHPIVLDMASSVAPEGKVRALFQAGKPVPEGWMIDAKGTPTTNSAELYADPPGALLPLGGAFAHKGYGLAFMIDILAGILTGAGYCEPNRVYPGDGLFAMAVNIENFMPLDLFSQQVAALARYVKDCPTAPGVDEIFVPGEVEARKREVRMRDGIFVEQGTWDLIEKVCQRFELDPHSFA